MASSMQAWRLDLANAAHPQGRSRMGCCAIAPHTTNNPASPKKPAAQQQGQNSALPTKFVGNGTNVARDGSGWWVHLHSNRAPGSELVLPQSCHSQHQHSRSPRRTVMGVSASTGPTHRSIHTAMTEDFMMDDRTVQHGDVSMT